MGMGILKTIFPELDFDRYQQTEIYEMMTNNPLVFFILGFQEKNTEQNLSERNSYVVDYYQQWKVTLRTGGAIHRLE